MEGYIAQIMLFAGNFAPRNWSFCDGSTISIASNTALFSLLGTTYGGNGQTTFMLPDLRGRVAIGAGSGPGRSTYALGQAAGSETITLTVNQMPAHTHLVNVPTSDQAGSSDEPAGNVLGAVSSPIYAPVPNPPGAGHYGGVTASSAGSSQPIDIRQPYLALNYVICMYGIFPSRN